MGLIDRLKDVKAPWARDKLDGSVTPAPTPAPAPAAPAAPDTEAAEQRDFSIPLHFLIAGGVLIAAWLGWTIYSAADRGVDAGVGVLVAWPTLLAMALVVLAPFAVIAALIVRVARGGEEADAEEEEEEEEDDESDEGEEEDEDDEEDDDAGEGDDETSDDEDEDED